MRLNQTVVLYDGWPYYVLTICNHKDDGYLRIYLDKMGTPEGLAINRYEVPYTWYDEPGDSRGDRMDNFLVDRPDCGIIRKKMNSPLFNKFRPFPLGMCNVGGMTSYLERSPVRHTQQGLTANMVSSTAVGTHTGEVRGYCPPVHSSDMADTILGNYPTAQESLEKLLDYKNIGNTAVAFHREFAFLRGPLPEILLLSYKGENVGYLPNSDFSQCKLSEKYKHLKEVTENLNLFSSVF